MSQTPPSVCYCLVRLIRRRYVKPRSVWLCVLWHGDRAMHRLIAREGRGKPPEAEALCRDFLENEHLWTPGLYEAAKPA